MTEEALLTDVETKEEEKKNGHKKHGVIVSYVPYDAITFEQVEEFTKASIASERVGELTRQFQDLTYNIMNSTELEDKTVAMDALVKEFNVRVQEAMKLDAGPTIVGGVIQMFKEQIMPKKKEEKQDGFMIWKDGDRYRWMAVYSNKYRDDDIPAEIISERAHEQFVKEVEAGVHDYPELWHWHIPGTRWGEADFIHYDKETGFSLASGFIDRGHEKEAETLLQIDMPIKVSHGMPEEHIKRDDNDKSVITAYASREISDLPAEVAANKLTGFEIIKEVVNMIPEEKKAYLKKVGMSDDAIASVEAGLDEKAGEAQEQKLEFKEGEKDFDANPDELVETIEVETESEPTAEPQYATREEVATAIVESVKPVVDGFNALMERFKDIEKTDEEKIADKAENVPAASISALIAQQMSVIGTSATKIDGRSKEAKDGPEEKEVIEDVTGIPFVDKMIADE